MDFYGYSSEWQWAILEYPVFRLKGGIIEKYFLDKLTMKYYGKSSLSLFLKILLDILGIGGFILFLFILRKNLSKGMNLSSAPAVVTCLLFIIGSISLFTILFYLRKIVISLIKVTPFISENVIGLKRISICCFIISATYVINFIINNKLKDFQLINIDSKGVHTDVEFLVFFFAGCFLLILSQVFKQAIAFKEDNDFTV